MVKRSFFILLAVFTSLAGFSQQLIEVSSENQILRINTNGEIQSIIDKQTLKERSFRAYTTLSDCEFDKKVKYQLLSNGGVEFTKSFVNKTNKKYRCSVTESFRPEGNSISWKVIIKGSGESWTTGIQTILLFGNTDYNSFWTTWGDPNHLKPSDNDSKQNWSDPLKYMPFRDMHLIYGGHFRLGGGYSIPLVSVAGKTENSGLSLLMSPDDMLFDMHLETTSTGVIKQTRYYNRINSENTIVLNMDIISHVADWRAPLNWMVNKYSGYFNPISSKTGEISGLGAYSASDSVGDAELYRKMGGIVNWRASFDFPYMGMFIPPVATDTTFWTKFSAGSDGEYLHSPKIKTSISKMGMFDSFMKKNGFYTLNYFNVTEFGGGSDYSDTMIYPQPIMKPAVKNSWINPSQFFYTNFPNALLAGSMGYEYWSYATVDQLLNPRPYLHMKPFYTWGGAFATDCGDSEYQKFLLQQAAMHISKFPDASGICIDRLDWLNEYNWKADDNKSWVQDHPVRSLITSWKEFIPVLSDVFHKEDKVVYCNTLINRLDLMKYIDGVYNEYGQNGQQLNLSAFLTLRKTFLAWTPDSSVVTSNPDEYFQRHLYMGAFPTAPFPANDHCIKPDGQTEYLYLKYGQLFNQLHDKRWVLTPGILKVINNDALANIFETGKFLIIPIVFAEEKEGIVRISIKKSGVSASMKNIVADYITPEKEEFASIRSLQQEDSYLFDVPVHKGCAILRIRI